MADSAAMSILPFKTHAAEFRSALVVICACVAMIGCTGPRAADGYSWGINQNESGLRLLYGLPQSDVIDYYFLCEAGRLHLLYSHDDGNEPYGSAHAARIQVTIGRVTRTILATADFDDGGSPSIDAPVSDPGPLLRDLALAEDMSTNDSWGEHTAPAPSPSIINRFAKRCAIPMK